MVYAFMIHTLQPGTCRILYSVTFGKEDLTLEQAGEPQSAISGSELRAVRKEQLDIVARQVQSEFSFRRAVSSRTYEQEMQILSSDESSLPFEKGVFRLRAGDPFTTERVVVWAGTANCAFNLVCDKNENRIQAETVLSTIIRHLQEYLKVIAQPTAALTKPDRITAILHQFLPHGQILFMNHRVVRQFEKEMETFLTGR
ncbi:AP-5 complex subunit sigma-1-like [Ptychodera flava]|uniref:AP-5 complex subunit sigma-1-like n=1 Tax=Ptychodera flava TaxID=63121 RepID=UPI003969E6CD